MGQEIASAQEIFFTSNTLLRLAMTNYRIAAKQPAAPPHHRVRRGKTASPLQKYFLKIPPFATSLKR